MKITRKVRKAFGIVLLIFLTQGFNLTAQPPPPPGHGSSGNRTGGTAPIGGGLFILLGLGAAYGGKKIYDIKKAE
jgi:hypothetical protein